MRPTEILSSEHRVIEQVLDCLEAMAERARADKRLDRPRAAAALEFLRVFADTCHHGKEEERLFPMLVARGLSEHMGPIAVMLDDHRAGREYIRRMLGALDGDDVDAFARAAQGYAALLREHIGKEDAVLFPMAESMLDAEARRALLDSFHHFEHHDLGAGTHERLLAVSDELARHYGVKPAADRTSAAAPHACGHRWP